MFDLFGMIREKGFNMISKELLSEVLKKEIREFVIEKNELRYILKDDINNIPELYFINIYELSHKCKEWANKNNYYVASGKYYENWDCEIFEISWDAKSWHEPEETFDAPTEPEAIFKACQWILDNKED